jgi:hypothetical protein
MSPLTLQFLRTSRIACILKAFATFFSAHGAMYPLLGATQAHAKLSALIDRSNLFPADPVGAHLETTK